VASIGGYGDLPEMRRNPNDSDFDELEMQLWAMPCLCPVYTPFLLGVGTGFFSPFSFSTNHATTYCELRTAKKRKSEGPGYLCKTSQPLKSCPFIEAARPYRFTRDYRLMIQISWAAHSTARSELQRLPDYHPILRSST
jgi:hypothetical protein